MKTKKPGKKAVKGTSKKVIITSGKRKRALARAVLTSGKGVVRINKILLETFSPAMIKTRIMEPLMLAGDIARNVNISVNVNGGGIQAQGEASRLAIARGLLEFSSSKELKKTYLDYDKHLLVADVRRNESHKPNDSKPRRKRTKSKR